MLRAAGHGRIVLLLGCSWVWCQGYALSVGLSPKVHNPPLNELTAPPPVPNMTMKIGDDEDEYAGDPFEPPHAGGLREAGPGLRALPDGAAEDPL